MNSSTLSGHDQIIQIFENEFNIPVEITLNFFSHLSIPYLHKTLGASFNQLVVYVRKTGFEAFKSQLMDIDGYQLKNNGSRVYFNDPSLWYLCDPIYMQCLFKCFKIEIIELLKTTVYYIMDKISMIAIHNRLDLLEIIYRETDEFLENVNVLDRAADNGNLSVVIFLNELGASCTAKAMDWAANFGFLEILRYLHLNRTEGCDQALVFASKNGLIEIVKYLVENELGILYIQRAIEVASKNGYLKIVQYLEDQ